MRKIRHLFFCLFALICIEPEKIHSTEQMIDDDKPLFVSLGCLCDVAGQIRSNHFREKAFPLDWILTLDYQGFFALLEDNFEFFLDERFLHLHSSGRVINSYYNIHFLHDWPDSNLHDHLYSIQKKYQRRIDRFNELASYKGKVYFIRAAFIIQIPVYSDSVITPECSKITYSDAETLRDILLKKFPDLDFKLVVINYEDESVPDIIGLENVIEFKVVKSQKEEDYKNIFQQLLSKESP